MNDEEEYDQLVAEVMQGSTLRRYEAWFTTKGIHFMLD